MVLEVRPPVPLDKGSGVRALRGRRAISQLLFAGDDRSDLDAFAEATIKIAVASKEAPPELIAAADAVVAGPGRGRRAAGRPRRRSDRGDPSSTQLLLAPVIARFGEAEGWDGSREISAQNAANIARSTRAGPRARRHLRDPGPTTGRFVIVRKPQFPPGAWRIPSGGIDRGESFETGVLREALRGDRPRDRADRLPAGGRLHVHPPWRRDPVGIARRHRAGHRTESWRRATASRSRTPDGRRWTS